MQAHRAEAEPCPVLQVTNGLSTIGSSTAAAMEDERLDEVPEELRYTGEASGAPDDGHDQLQPPAFLAMTRTNTAETILERSTPPSLAPGKGGKMGTVGRGGLAFAEGGTTRFTPQAWDRPALPGTPLTPSFDRPGMLDSHSSPPPASPTSDRTVTLGGAHSDDSEGEGDFGLPRNFVPSLTTIEKAASTRIFFETKYHALLKKPRDRDQRKAMLEAELARLQMTDRQRNTVRAAWALSETEYLRDMRKKVGVGSFKQLKIIGHGGEKRRNRLYRGHLTYADLSCPTDQRSGSSRSSRSARAENSTR